MTLLDTNVLIQFFKQDPVILAELHRLGLRNLATSDVVVAELYQGALNKPELKRIEAGLARLHIFPITQEISALMVNLLATYSLSHRLHFPDALIAATALHHGIALYTLNLKDFRYVADLGLYQPAQP